MNILRPLPLLITVLILGTIAYFILRSGPEDQIRAKLNELAETVSTPAANTDGLLGKAKIIASFQDLLANPVALDTQYSAAQGIRSPKELAAAYLSLLQSGQSVTLEFNSPSITFPHENESKVETKVKASLSRNQQPIRTESGTLYITLGKDPNGDWKFERFSQHP
ncbi:MAG: hypothetical protein ACQKBT_05065 [Puniceicoccales bacterium]